MDDMIKRILNVDKLARDAKNEIQKENVTLEEEIKERKKEIREDYLKRAYERIKENEILEEKSSAQKIEKNKKDTEKILNTLENIKNEKMDIWVKELKNRVLNLEEQFLLKDV